MSPTSLRCTWERVTTSARHNRWTGSDVARRSPPLAAVLAQGERRGVMDALLDLLSDPFQPAVVVFEDTQWAYEATLDVIKFLGRRIGRANGLLVLTYRDDEVNSGHPLRQVLGELPPGYLGSWGWPASWCSRARSRRVRSSSG